MSLGVAAPRLLLGDCLERMGELPDDSVDLVLTDPPYFRVKPDAWDRQWSGADGFLEWLDTVLIELRRVLRPNGSLYLFASPQMSARVELAVGRRFRVLNSITWAKAAGWAQGSNKGGLRAFFPSSERIVFAEQSGGDGYARGAAGHSMACDRLRGEIFEPIRVYLAGEWERAGLTTRDANAATCSQMAGHYFTQSQWALPTPRRYRMLRDYANANGGDYFARDHADLKREHDELRVQFDELRRPFNGRADKPFTDVWTYATVQGYPGKHPCEKPLDMISDMVEIASRPGAVVLDPFLGSGTTGVACRNLGRSFIGIERDEGYMAMAERRIADDTTRPDAGTLALELDEAMSA